MTPLNIFNDKQHLQFKVQLEGETASLEYRLHDGMIILMHTEVPERFGGHGIGSALAQFGLDFARQNHMPVKVYCPFVAAYIKRHPEYQDIVVNP
jgi:uncharacterized protein